MYGLDPDTIARVAELGVSLGLDLYPPDEADVEADDRKQLSRRMTIGRM
jgi:hypothetical protein